MARRTHALPHPIRNQIPPFLVTELSANPIGNQNTAFLVTEYHVAQLNRCFEQEFRGGDPGWLPGVAIRRGGQGRAGTAGGLPRHRRRSVAGAAAIIRPAAGSNIPEGLSSPACYCPLPGAGSRIIRFKDLPKTPRPYPATPARRKRSGGRGMKGRLDELWWSGQVEWLWCDYGWEVA